MMKVTELIKELIHRMWVAGIPKECTIAIVSNLKREEQQKAMLEFMKKNPHANAIQASEKANQIFKI